jgi:Calx-beta domain-containing protein/beta-propeller repeat-containing protein
MRKTILAIILAIILFDLMPPLHKAVNRVSASNANPFPAQGLASVSINNASVTEGNSGTINMDFTVTVTGSHTNTIGVNYSTTNGSATAPSDYISSSGQLVFIPTSSATRTISVPVVGDTISEPDETLIVNLTIVDFSATLSDGQGVGTIRNDDATAPQVPALFISDLPVNEGNIGTTGQNPTASFAVSLSVARNSEVTVNYATADGTATVADGDYVSQSGTVVFPANDTTPKTISIQVLSDSRIEPNETFFVRLTSPTGATIQDGEGVCTILNDDGEPTLPALSINSVSIPEGDFGTVDATFEVRLTFASNATVTVNYATADGTATVPTDYHAISGTVTFPPGDSSPKTISIPIVGDDRSEPIESFFVNLSNPQGAIIADGQGVCTIFNDDSVCTYTFTTGGGKLIGQVFSATGGTGSITITGQAACAWTAFVADGGSFVTLTSASSGSANGSLSYSVAPNLGPERTASIHFAPADQTFTVIQEGSDCPASAYTITPSAILFQDNEIPQGRFQVDAPLDCDWIISTEDSWIDLKPPTIRKGSGTVFFDVKPNPGLWRSGTINVAGKSVLVQQISSECVTEFLCSYFRNCRFAASTLSVERRFRDDVLARTSRGKRYAELYYKFSTEAVGIITLNPMLILRSREMMERYLPVVQSMANGEPVTLTAGDIEEIDGFLSTFAEKGGAELRETIKDLCEDLRNPQVHSEFHITVTPGPKRESPGQISLLRITLSGLMIAPLGLFIICFHRRNPIRRKRVKTAVQRLFCAAIVFSMVGSSSNPLAGRGAGSQARTNHLTSCPANPEEIKAVRANETLGMLPLSFEANQGQFDSQVRFISRAPGYSLYLTATEAVIAFGGGQQSIVPAPGPRPLAPATQIIPAPGPRAPTPATQCRMKLIDSNPDQRIRGLDEIQGRANYFIGDPAKWCSNIPSYARVEYENVYKGVDLVYYGSGRELEYDFILAPGADPAAIRFSLEGADDIEIDSRGELVMRVPGSEVRHRKPKAYQEVNGARSEIACCYGLIQNPKSKSQNEQIGFEVGDYDNSRPLIIDPVLAYSTYFGGGGIEESNSIAVDSAGNVYVTGFTDSINFPIANAPQTKLGGGQDAFVAKLDSSGTRLLYSTYLGGAGQDNGTSIAVDATGNAYITGFTDSTDFPVKNALQSTKKGNFNAFVVKLDTAGSVLNSTLFGGSIIDYGSSIAVDSAGNTYFAGLATSPDIPMISALQPTHGGLVDIYVAKIDSSGTRLVFSTYLGGSGIEGANSIAVDSAGNIYLTGMTSSLDFRTMNALQTTRGGGIFDAFVVKLNASGTQILYSTFLGGSGEDRAFRIAVDAVGSAYVTGDTDSIDFPVRNALQPTKGGSSDAFVAKLNPDGKALAYSTYLGGTGIDGGTAIAVDSSGSAHVAGFTRSNDFPTASALQRMFGGGSYDAFLTRLSPGGTALDYSTYMGGGGIDTAFGVAVDSGGNAHVMGVTDSSNFPTANALQRTFGGGTADLFIASIKTGPTISNGMVNGKKLLVQGSGFDSGAKILLNGQQQKTASDEQSPSTTLIGKKAGKMIDSGQTVTLQVRNADGTLSNEFRFTRPAS